MDRLSKQSSARKKKRRKKGQSNLSKSLHDILDRDDDDSMGERSDDQDDENKRLLKVESKSTRKHRQNPNSAGSVTNSSIHQAVNMETYRQGGLSRQSKSSKQFKEDRHSTLSDKNKFVDGIATARFMKGQHFNFNGEVIEDENEDQILFSNNNSYMREMEDYKNEKADEDTLVR